VVIQQNSLKLLMMDILMSEICWAHKKWNKIARYIKLVFYFSGFSLQHGYHSTFSTYNNARENRNKPTTTQINVYQPHNATALTKVYYPYNLMKQILIFSVSGYVFSSYSVSNLPVRLQILWTKAFPNFVHSLQFPPPVGMSAYTLYAVVFYTSVVRINIWG